MQFLVQSWEDDNLIPVLQGKTMFANGGNICYSYKVHDGKILKTVEPLLYCSHEEADWRMIYDLASISLPNSVVIRTADTDVLIIALVVLLHSINK